MSMFRKFGFEGKYEVTMLVDLPPIHNYKSSIMLLQFQPREERVFS